MRFTPAPASRPVLYEPRKSQKNPLQSNQPAPAYKPPRKNPRPEKRAPPAVRQRSQPRKSPRRQQHGKNIGAGITAGKRRRRKSGRKGRRDTPRHPLRQNTPARQKQCDIPCPPKNFLAVNHLSPLKNHHRQLKKEPEPQQKISRAEQPATAAPPADIRPEQPLIDGAAGFKRCVCGH